MQVTTAASKRPAPLSWSTALIDVLTIGLGALILLIFVTSVAPTRRGFYCSDDTIQYPFKPSTVPNYLLYVYGFTIPFVLITLTELLVHRHDRTSSHFIFRSAPSWLVHLYRSIVDLLFGMVAAQLITDIGKYTIGRLRPNFISVCGPDVEFWKCDAYNHTYITDYKCLNSPTDASESRVSFPSGHSSFSAYTMFYTAIYIQVKWSLINLRILKHGVQLILILLAYFTALSRVMDNKHHWSDVFAGGVIGVGVACVTASTSRNYGPVQPQLQLMQELQATRIHI